MSRRTDRCVALLAELIAHDTANPGGDEVALCRHLAEALEGRGADRVLLREVPGERHGQPVVGAYVFAAWGEPRTLINVHVDTVPPNRGWTRDPFRARVTGDRVVGLGAADIKGAIAALLVALEERRPTDLGVLFSGDEELGGSCLPAFLASEAARPVKLALVSEPTRRVVGTGHRGIRAYRATVEGPGGHSSVADELPKPLLDMAYLATALDQLAGRYREEGPADMKGLCFNVGSVEGGVAFNVVADRAALVWSVRPFPELDVEAFEEEMEACARRVADDVRLERLVLHPPFETREPACFHELLGSHVQGYGPLQFWTEAATFSGHGIDAVVVGPGDIRQAHTADEFLLKNDLDWAVDLYVQVLARAHQLPRRSPASS